MTAVDRAELKRLAEAARAARLAYADAAVGNVVSLCRAADDALEALDVACQPYEDTLIALLSEIEGLKAERDTWKAMAENGASGIVAHIERAAEAERQLATLRPQTAESGT